MRNSRLGGTCGTLPSGNSRILHFCLQTDAQHQKISNFPLASFNWLMLMPSSMWVANGRQMTPEVLSNRLYSGPQGWCRCQSISTSPGSVDAKLDKKPHGPFLVPALFHGFEHRIRVPFGVMIWNVYGTLLAQLFSSLMPACRHGSWFSWVTG